MADHLVVDSDVDLHDPRQRGELSWPLLAAIAAGGALGGLARYGIGLALPPRPGGFAWATFIVNVSGCLLIGGLMVLLARRWPDSRLIRPFAGVGVLGGYTTFSTYVLDVRTAVVDGRPGLGLAYLAATLVCAVGAVWVGIAVTRRVVK